MISALLGALLLAPLLGQGDRGPAGEEPPGRVVVASKTFTESRVLAEAMAQMLEAHTDLEVVRKLGLGGTLLCLEALRSAEADLYPEYTGTAWAVILKERGRVEDPLRTFLTVQRRSRDELGLAWLEPFGLDNTYAIAMTRARATELGVARISDLVAHTTELRAGVSIEFLEREDGWPGLSEAYGLQGLDVRGMEHALGYAALQSGRIDLIDAYSTDGKLGELDLVVLTDDRGFFPPYHAAPLVRAALLDAHPEVGALLARLAWRISDETMQRLNLEAERSGDFAGAARGFLLEEGLLSAAQARALAAAAPRRGAAALLARTLEHLRLTGLAVLLAALFAIPLGVVASRRPGTRRVALGLAGVVQTIPSLALLALLIPVPGFGLGARSAVFALFLYAVLPILRNTVAGIAAVDPQLVEAARGMGLRERDLLRHLELPLAAGTITAGVRTSAVVSVGVATLAAFIGAGGLGEPILVGLELDDPGLILGGALPAAGLALLVDFLLGLVERRVVARVG